MAIFKGKNKDKVNQDKKPADMVKFDSADDSIILPKVEDAGAYRIVTNPQVSEKGSYMAAYNKYVFRVEPRANKTEIKKSVSKLYKVAVAKVNIVKVPAKNRKVGGHEGKKPGFKKAVVTLQKGHTIDIAK